MDAYYSDGALYCEECAPEGSECVANGGGEADSPMHCPGCNVFLENPLTSDGVLYVADQIKTAHSNEKMNPHVVNEWATFYYDALRDLPAIKLDAYAWPGGYPLFYMRESPPVCGRKMDIPGLGFYVEGNQMFCPECAGKIARFVPLRSDVHWEGEPYQCDECGEDIETAYGDPDDQNDNS